MLDANKYSYSRLSHYKLKTVTFNCFQEKNFNLKFLSGLFGPRSDSVVLTYRLARLASGAQETLNEWDSGNLRAWSNSAFNFSMMLGKTCNQFGPSWSHI